jgi:hypothetical protein
METEMPGHDQVMYLVRTGRKLSADKKAIDEELKLITEKIDALVPVGWELVVDGVPAAKRGPNRAFSKILALAKLNADEKKACIASGYDEKKIRALAEAKGVLEECMEPGNGKPSVRLTP